MCPLLEAGIKGGGGRHRLGGLCWRKGAAGRGNQPHLHTCFHASMPMHPQVANRSLAAQLAASHGGGGGGPQAAAPVVPGPQASAALMMPSPTDQPVLQAGRRSNIPGLQQVPLPAAPDGSGSHHKVGGGLHPGGSVCHCCQGSLSAGGAPCRIWRCCTVHANNPAPCPAPVGRLLCRRRWLPSGRAMSATAMAAAVAARTRASLPWA